MAILQALLSLLTRSVGRILNAMFGWAVRALFGRPSPAEEPYLLAIVAAAAAWPVLLLGVALPKVVALIVAFVPFHNRVPPWVMRTIWSTLALVVPVAVGLTVAHRAPPGLPREPLWKRILRGWPITVALAGAFLFMFVTVPALKLISLVRRRHDEQLPLVVPPDGYEQVAALVAATLRSHGIAVTRRAPPVWATAPTTLLLRLGGAAFRGYVPEKMEYYSESSRNGLEATLYPNGLLLRGERYAVIRAHALVSESLSHSPALQTLDLRAQAVETRLHQLWNVHDREPEGHAGVPALLEQLEALVEEASAAKIPFDDWQVLYRQLLQLDRALHGRTQLIEGTIDHATAGSHQAAQRVERRLEGEPTANDSRH
jgi:hypothetical protein